MRLLRAGGVAVLAVAALTLAACGGGTSANQSGGSSSSITNSTLTVAETVPPQTFDPIQSSQIATMYAWQLVYNGLVTIGPNGKVQPDLATSWTVSADHKTYVFTLRKGAKFSNGSPLTADDVAFSFQRLLAHGLPYAQSRFPTLESVTKIDSSHVRFQLKTPDAGFLYNLGSPFLIGSAVVSKSFLATHNPKTQVLGAGLFKVVSYTPNSELVLQRNPYYWNKAAQPKYKTLVIKYMPDQSAQAAALESGQVDLIFPSSEDVLQLKNNSKVTLKSVAGTNTLRLNINTKRAPFNNVDFRRAISVALDRKAIAQGAFFGQAVASAQLPPSIPYAVPLGQLPNQQHNIAEAKSLLAKAGYPNGISITLDHLAGYATYLDRFAQLVKSELAPAGIRVTIQAEQNTVWLNNQNTANYDIMDNVYAFTGDPMTLLSPRPGRQGPNPASITALMNQALAGAPADYAKNIKKLETQEDNLVFPDIAVAAPLSTIAYGPNVKSAQPEPTAARQFLAAVILK